MTKLLTVKVCLLRAALNGNLLAIFLTAAGNLLKCMASWNSKEFWYKLL